MSFGLKCLFQLIAILCLFGCQTIDPKNFGLSENEWQKLSQEKKAKLESKFWLVKKQHIFSSKIAYKTKYKELELKFVNGKALMWPSNRKENIKPFSTTISSGNCKILDLKNKENSTNLEICYNGRVLSIDPSKYLSKYSNGSVNITQHHLWQQGLMYSNLKSNGYAKLSELNLLVRVV